MTIDEKRKVINDYCESQFTCNKCKLNAGHCVAGDGVVSPKEVEESYALIVEDEPIEESEVIENITPQVEPNVDVVNHPTHYETGKMECIDAMIETQGVEAVKNFCVCNAFKYLWRHEFKNQVEDIKKAIWYLNKFVELEESQCTDMPTEIKC